MNITFKGEYKSLTNFEWLDVPKLVVFTGLNGSGKTQLLDLIHNSVVEQELSERAHLSEKFAFDEIVYLRGDWNINKIPTIDIATVQQEHKSLYSRAFASYDNPKTNNANNNYRENDLTKQKYDSLTRTLGKNKRYQVTYEEFSEAFPKNHLNVQVSIHRQISAVFFNYHIAKIEAISKGLSTDEIKEKIGIAPWTVLRDIIHHSKLPFQINDPSELSIWDGFDFKLTHSITKKEISFVDLSSGEKILLSIIFYLFQSQEKGIFPKLLLMDEPDAHLHPSMTQQFLNVVDSVLVQKFGIQVFMTTHSPSTVMLAPIDSLFEVCINEPRIRRPVSKNHLISTLTAGLVFVGDGTRYFLVEDQFDVDFYNFLNKEFLKNNLVNSNIPLVFIKASTEHNTGGKTVVNNWVVKLINSGLIGIVFGLIDKDYDNKQKGGVFTINRYSIENYLIDPLVLFVALIEAEYKLDIPNFSFSIGEEYKIKALMQSELQFIADTICDKIESKLKSLNDMLDCERIEVNYINGLNLYLPKWLLYEKGKVIINSICSEIFGGKINQGTLFKAFRRLQLIPTELKEKFLELQQIQ